MSDRTFKVTSPLMNGSDVAEWQRFLYDDFRSRWGIDYPLDVDGYYGVASRSATATFMRAWGVEDTGDALSEGLTSWWRSKLRNSDRTDEEVNQALSDEVKDYRQRLRARYANSDVCYPVPNLITDAWGYHPGVHDGVDLIGTWKQPVLAICTCKVVRVSASGWWGLGASASVGHPVSDGDGIIIIESTVNVGPFREGLHFGYGHTEGAVVSEGDRIPAGAILGRMGFAKAAHVHMMCNDNPPVNGFHRGVGDRDPQPYLSYAKNNGGI